MEDLSLEAQRKALDSELGTLIALALVSRDPQVQQAAMQVQYRRGAVDLLEEMARHLPQSGGGET